MGAITFDQYSALNIVSILLVPTITSLIMEEIDFATLHRALGETNQFAVKSIISLREIESARFVQVGWNTLPEHKNE